MYNSTLDTWQAASSNDNHGDSTRNTLHGFNDTKSPKQSQMSMSREPMFTLIMKVDGVRGRRLILLLSIGIWKMIRYAIAYQ
jgi:hypothetical protein